MRLASDNAGPVHPRIMAALAEANEGWAMPYGRDDWTERAVARIREVFEAPGAAVCLTPTGTSANALLLATLAAPYQSVFCTEAAHIYQDECNAVEFYTGGARLTLVADEAALMSPDDLARRIAELARGGVHGAQPGPVSITQITERGTAYPVERIREIAGLAHGHGLAVHMDGSRLANALAATGVSPAEMTWKAGIDALSLGGSKNGCMGVEAAILFDPAKAWEFELRRKRGGHLFSKSRYLGAQMDAYLADGLWLDMAGRANAAAARLAAGIRRIPGARILHEPAGNMVFAEFPRALHRRLHAAGAIYSVGALALDGDPDEAVGARLVADWSCPPTQVEEFLAILRG